MTKQQQPEVTSTIELPGTSMIPGAAAIEKASHIGLPSQQVPSKEVQEIAEKGKAALAEQLVIAGITAHAELLAQALWMSGMQRFEEVVVFDRAIRDKPRHAVDQLDIEAFNQGARQAYARSSVAIIKRGDERLKETLDASLKRPEEKQKVRIIKEAGWVSKIFGGADTITEVLE